MTFSFINTDNGVYVDLSWIFSGEKQHKLKKELVITSGDYTGTSDVMEMKIIEGNFSNRMKGLSVYDRT